MAELARIIVRRSATVGAAAFAAAALMGLGAGTAAADNFGYSCEASANPHFGAENSQVRNPAVQGEVRAAGNEEVLANPGTVNGDNARVLGRAVPDNQGAPFWWGPVGDMSSGTAAMPGSFGWLDTFPNPCG